MTCLDAVSDQTLRSSAALREASPLRVRFAEPRDDESIRRLLRSRAMDGAILLSMEREPSYFASLDRECLRHDTVVMEDARRGEIVGMGARLVHEAVFRGEPARIGYLSQLRLEEGRLMPIKAARQAWRLLNSCRRDDEMAFDVTSIAADNDRARRLLERGPVRTGQPRYEPLVEYVVHVVPTTFHGRSTKDVEVCEASAEQWIEVMTLRRDRLANAPLAMLGCDDPDPALRLVAIQRNRVVAGLAVEDPSSHRQFVVRGYGGPLRWSRPLVNLAALTGFGPRLPRVGEAMRFATVTSMGCESGSESALAAMLHQAAKCARSRGIDFLLAGAVVGDPVAEAIDRAFLGRSRPYRTLIYTVAWSALPDTMLALKPGDMHMELHAL